MSSAPYASLADFYRDSAYAAFPQEHRLGGSAPVRLVRVDQPAHDLVDPAVPELVLVLVLAADTSVRWNCGDGWCPSQHARAGRLMLCPSDTEIAYRCDGEHGLLLACLPSDPVADLLGRCGADGPGALDALAGRRLFDDEPTRAALLRLWSEAARDDTASALTIDGLTNVLLARLLHLAAPSSPTRGARALSRGDLARVRELVGERLAEDLDIETLADAAERSPTGFDAAFRESTGRSPAAFVTALRVARACELLGDSDAPIPAIAAACGFSSTRRLQEAFAAVRCTFGWRVVTRAASPPARSAPIVQSGPGP